MESTSTAFEKLSLEEMNTEIKEEEIETQPLNLTFSEESETASTEVSEIPNASISHEDLLQQEQEQSSASITSTSAPPTLCRFYNNAVGCRKGDDCTFLHEIKYCTFYNTRKGCNKGSLCKFRHDSSAPMSSFPRSRPMRRLNLSGFSGLGGPRNARGYNTPNRYQKWPRSARTNTSSAAIHPCPNNGCSNSCRGKQCRDCHEKMMAGWTTSGHSSFTSDQPSEFYPTQDNNLSSLGSTEIPLYVPSTQQDQNSTLLS